MRNLWVGGAWLLGLVLFSASAHAGEPALLRGMALSEPSGNKGVGKFLVILEHIVPVQWELEGEW